MFCREVVPAGSVNQYDLLGVFSKLVAPNFPCWLNFEVWLWLSGDDERGLLEVICRKDGETAWFRRVLEAPVDLLPHDEVFVRFRADAFCFPRPGRYRFEISLDGAVFGVQRLLVVPED